MEEARKIKLEIAGASYTVTTTEQEGYVRDLAAAITDDIISLSARNPAPVSYTHLTLTTI